MISKIPMVRPPLKTATDWLDSDQPEQVIGLLLKCLHHSLRQAVDEALREHAVGLSFAQFATLMGLLHDPGVTGAQLARRAMVSPQTMNSVLRRLEQDGLITRRPHPESRRADSWFIDTAGKQQLTQARAVGDSVFIRMLTTLGATEVQRLESYLRRCLSALKTSPCLTGQAVNNCKD